MTEFYRFRSIKRLLCCGELENQTIYFAKPEELNDPMEGYRDIVWRGDKIVWTNFFKHYVHTFFWTYGLAQVIDDTEELKIADILVEKQWNDPLTPQAKFLFEKIWNSVFSKCELNKLSNSLAIMEREIRYKELLTIIRFIHYTIFSEVQRAHFEQESMPKSIFLLSENFFHNFKNFIFEFTRRVIDRKKIEYLYSNMDQKISEIQLGHKYNLHTHIVENFEKNMQRLFFDFPEIYLKRFEDLLWPQWYTACFTKNYHNASLWGNYGDSHKGICLILESLDSDNEGNSLLLDGSSMIFHEVRYAEKIVEIDFFRSIGQLPAAVLMELWYSDKKGNISECASHLSEDKNIDSPWRKKYWDNFYSSITTKTKDWRYEQEYRIIETNLLGYFENSDRMRRYDFNSLKGIIFGMKVSDEDKCKIIEIIKRKCEEEKHTEFKFFQADYSPKDGDIRIYETFKLSHPT